MVAVEQADGAGMSSCLISGGCDLRGCVPVRSHLSKLEALRAGRRLNWHVGMIDEDDVSAIAGLVDVISFDFVGDQETIREVYGLDYTPQDYLHTYEHLCQRFAVVPHLTLGLRGGHFSGEYLALEMLKTAGLRALVVLVLIPTPGTRYEKCCPPHVEEVIAFLAEARRRLPLTPIYLGCMRPGGAYRRTLDPLAVRAGVDKVVNPSRSAVAVAQELGLQVQWENECCVFPKL